MERRIEREKEGKKRREEKEEWKGTSREDRVGWAKNCMRTLHDYSVRLMAHAHL